MCLNYGKQMQNVCETVGVGLSGYCTVLYNLPYIHCTMYNKPPPPKKNKKTIGTNAWLSILMCHH